MASADDILWDVMAAGNHPARNVIDRLFGTGSQRNQAAGGDGGSFRSVRQMPLGDRIGVNELEDGVFA